MKRFGGTERKALTRPSIEGCGRGPGQTGGWGKKKASSSLLSRVTEK